MDSHPPFQADLAQLNARPGDIFDLHRSIVDDYRAYIRSFVTIADDQVRKVVEESFKRGDLWPEPLLQLNPAYEEAGRLEELIHAGLLHEKCAAIFSGYRLHWHQREAIELGRKGRDFIVTSGTGSGKSLTYIATIFNHLLRNEGPIPPGVTAVIVYPLNALVNSQEEELRRYAENYRRACGQKFPIRFAKFTGQENLERRQALETEPPHILLTNYMMLELLLTRGGQQGIRQAIYDELRFLIFDELHTYRGRQGADVGLLIRRIRAKTKQPVTCIGTSATMVSGGSIADQKQQVANVARQLFGKPFAPEAIVQEKLRRCLPETPGKAQLAAAVISPVFSSAPEDALLTHPTPAWIESRIALAERDGELVRNRPHTFTEIAEALARDTGHDAVSCATHLRNVLLWLGHVNAGLPPERKRYPYLPFKLHQFFSQTGAVYASLDRDGTRHITLETGLHAPGEPDRPLFPAVFSRYSGATFLCVNHSPTSKRLTPRSFYPSQDADAEETSGYLIPDSSAWAPETDTELLPDSWLEEGPGRNAAGSEEISRTAAAADLLRPPWQLLQRTAGWMDGRMVHVRADALRSDFRSDAGSSNQGLDEAQSARRRRPQHSHKHFCLRHSHSHGRARQRSSRSAASELH